MWYNYGCNILLSIKIYAFVIILVYESSEKYPQGNDSSLLSCFIFLILSALVYIVTVFLSIIKAYSIWQGEQMFHFVSLAFNLFPASLTSKKSFSILNIFFFSLVWSFSSKKVFYKHWRGEKKFQLFRIKYCSTACLSTKRSSICHLNILFQFCWNPKLKFNTLSLSKYWHCNFSDSNLCLNFTLLWTFWKLLLQHLLPFFHINNNIIDGKNFQTAHRNSAIGTMKIEKFSE